MFMFLKGPGGSEREYKVPVDQAVLQLCGECFVGIIAYDLDGQYAHFRAVVGGAERNGTVVFQVYADDELVFDSGTMHGLRSAKEIDLPVTRVRTLRLVVTDAGDHHYSDMANWANARLRKAK